MVVTYTEEELLSYESGACLPEGVDLTPFVTLVATVTEVLRQLDEQNPYRRKSFTGHKLTRKAKQPKEIVDEDGWTSFIPKSTPHNAVDDEADIDDEAVADDGFEVPTQKKGKQHTMKFKTNAAKISSGKSGVADSRDTIAITQVSKFNAFDALLSDDE